MQRLLECDRGGGEKMVKKSTSEPFVEDGDVYTEGVRRGCVLKLCVHMCAFVCIGLLVLKM